MKQWLRFFSSIVALAPIIGTAATPLVLTLIFGFEAGWPASVMTFIVPALCAVGIWLALESTAVLAIYIVTLLAIFALVPIALFTKRRLLSTIAAATCAGMSALTLFGALLPVFEKAITSNVSTGLSLAFVLALLAISAAGKCCAILIGHKVFGLSWFKAATAVGTAILSLLVLMIIGGLLPTIATCVAAAIVWGLVASRKPALPPQDPSLQ